MGVVSSDERRVIQTRLLGIGAANLALVYGDATGEPADWVLNDAPAATVVKLIGRLGNDAVLAMAVCEALIALTPAHPDNPNLRAIADRLQAQAAQALADPTKEIWIGSEPVVDRAGLRVLLSELHSGFDHSVIYVAGGPLSGRSHSFQLIRHVAQKLDIPIQKVGFDVETEKRTVHHLFDCLHDAYNIAVGGTPVTEGATPGDAASKLVRHLRNQLQNMPYVDPRLWLVIDFSDEVPDPAVPEFLRLFCADRDANAFNNCVLFVLGPTAHLDTMRGELYNMQVEDLRPVNQTDVLEAAAILNGRGTVPLDEDAVTARASEIYDALAALPETGRLPELRRRMLDLRREVRAP
ncbi:hypothetical protein SAMN04488105_104363 [Salipiger thiooxidans]|uniref:Uncharacterized protein n=1 Tax=Salipiger thiooxidans TaxID=282683 RepID=A0A1G7DS17_9RHOB|nr:hypothetical protein [Salipiger thiooxidans]SDE53665.1 hypothetical protein SAMN04488105_104363 [Salipiger thiooxidans]